MKLLVIEDNILLVRGLKECLGKNFVVQSVTKGRDGIERAETDTFDLILLDLKLPDISGQDVCRAIRAVGIETPIVILSAIGNVPTKVELLELGADDYLTKPFNASELMARLNAVLRRAPFEFKPSTLKAGDLLLDTTRRRVERSGKRIDLRRKEFDILEYLLRSKGRVVTRTMIFNHVWEFDKDSWSNTVDVHIKYLRDKVDRPFGRKLIKTAHGLGYKIDDKN